jgi:bacillolysin
VLLEPGFSAANGSTFRAYLEPCSSSRWKTVPHIIMSDAERGMTNNIAQNAGTSEESAMASDKATEGVTVAPNPFTGSFTLSINSKANVKAQVTVYNAYGAKVKEQTGVNLVKGLNKLSLNCSNFASGVYMLEVNFGDSKVEKRIIKAK